MKKATNQVIDRQKVYKGFFTVERVQVQHHPCGGENIETSTYELVDRGDAAAVVLFLPMQQEFIFVRQFRPSLLGCSESHLTEIVAGMIDKGESPLRAIQREIFEETGFQVMKVEKMGVYILSPGGLTERVHLFYAETSLNDKVAKGGGLSSEKEEIEIIYLSASQVKHMLLTHQFQDAKTVIGLHYALAKAGSQRPTE